MNFTARIFLMGVMVCLATSAFGQIKFPDGSSQTTAYVGASNGGSGNIASGANATIGGGTDNFASKTGQPSRPPGTSIAAEPSSSYPTRQAPAPSS